MSVPATTPRRLAPLAIVTVVALLFALLLLLVRLQWAPLESVDHSTATWLNSLIAAHPVVVSIVKAVTWLGSSGVLWTLTGAAAVVLALQRRWRLATTILIKPNRGAATAPAAGHWAFLTERQLTKIGKLRPQTVEAAIRVTDGYEQNKCWLRSVASAQSP